jgi:hypothetical protein
LNYVKVLAVSGSLNVFFSFIALFSIFLVNPIIGNGMTGENPVKKYLLYIASYGLYESMG